MRRPMSTIQCSADQLLNTITCSTGGSSLPDLLKTYRDPARLMTLLGCLLNTGEIELTSGKYKHIKH